MKKSKKILIILIILILIAIIGVLVYYFNFKDTKEEVKTLKSIPQYGYELKENETDLYKKTFEELEKTLSNSPVDEQQYAKIIAKLFIIDFYTLNNKLSKNDIGGLEFIKESMRDNFIEEARSTFYKYVEINPDSRNQSLPEVSEIKDVKLEETTFTIKNNKTTSTTSTNKAKTTNIESSVNAYKVTISWDYTQDLGYETEANMIIVKEGKKLYIVEMD